MYREVAYIRSDYKKSYLWWFRNIPLKKGWKRQASCTSSACSGEGVEGVAWFRVCGVLLDVSANWGSVGVLFTHDMVSVVLVLWRVGATLANGHGI